MDKLEASLKTIAICSEMSDTATSAIGAVFDSRKMLKAGILNTIEQLQEIVEELEKEDLK
jgi:hypothetical protein